MAVGEFVLVFVLLLLFKFAFVVLILAFVNVFKTEGKDSFLRVWSIIEVRFVVVLFELVIFRLLVGFCGDDVAFVVVGCHELLLLLLSKLRFLAVEPALGGIGAGIVTGK